MLKNVSDSVIPYIRLNESYNIYKLQTVIASHLKNIIAMVRHRFEVKKTS